MQLPQLTSRSLLPTWLLRATVIVMLVAYCLALGMAAGQGHETRSRIMLALPFMLVGVICVIRYFSVFLLALPIAALAVPIDFPTGTESKLPISMVFALLLTGIWFVSMSYRGWKLLPSPLNMPLIVFSVICVISLIWGIIWRDPTVADATGRFIVVQIAALFAILLSISAGLLIGNFVKTARQLQYIVAIFIVFCSLTALIKLLHLPLFLVSGRGLWGLWLVAPAYGLLIAQPRLRWYWRALLLLLLFLTLFQTMVLDSYWLSGWVPSIAAIYAITFLHSRKIFFVLLIIGVIATYTTRGWFEQVAQDNIDDGALGRLSLWDQNWHVVKDHWLFGTGPAGYAIYYLTFFRDDARSTHNNYMDILGQFGFSGMLAWLWLVVASLWEGWTLMRRAPPGFLRTMVIIATGGWSGAMISMFFGDWVLPFAYNQTIGGYKYTVYSWFFLGTLISLRQLLHTQGSPSRSTELAK
jgi:O-antigen ligase